LKSADFILPQGSPIKRTLPFVVVCEGYGDVCFIAELLQHKNIEVCNVGCPTQKSFGDGKDAIPAYLKGLATDKKGLKGVLVVVDADDKPDTFFASMGEALRSATFPVPEKPFTVEDKEIRVGIFLVPRKDQKGTLDNLLLEAVFKKHPEAQECIEKFVDCTKSSKAWKLNQQAKMKLSALLAAYCEGNPWTSLAWVWSTKGNPIPIESDCFKHLTDLLAAFCA
jgi:hypothetical protein